MNNSSKIKFTVLGGGQEIGANSYLLEWNGKKILLDAGRHPEREDISALPNIYHIGAHLDAIFISHVHNDHIGTLPIIVDRFPGVPVYMTEPSAAISYDVIKDGLKLARRRREYR